jgi:uncharacterized protein YpmB
VPRNASVTLFIYPIGTERTFSGYTYRLNSTDMRTLNAISSKIVALTIFFTGLFGVSAYAQQSTTQQNNTQQNGNNPQNNQQQTNQQQKTGTTNAFAGDTVTYVLNGSDLSFDSKRTLIYDDKHIVDSLINNLATRDNKKYRIIYKKQGQQAKEISTKYLRKIDKTGFYKITIAYNKPQLSEDASPLYILSSK